MSYDADNEVCSCKCSVDCIICDFLLYMGKIMEKMNYTPVWWKIHRECKMSLNTVYDFEWCFDYDTDYSKDLLSQKSMYLMKDGYDRVGGIYYRMCR